MTPAMQVLVREVERTWDLFRRAVYVDRDVAAALALLDDAATLVDMPAMTGGNSPAEIAEHLAGLALPADLAVERVSRTVDTRRVVDELRWTFTHDRELSWLLPGVPATGRPARVLGISVVAVRHARITSVRTLWDVRRAESQVGAVVTARRPEPAADGSVTPSQSSTRL
ncbi:nuclear transport factor 2 family protein [Pseudonocardia sp. WMMC193]|uniref:nuclear transport factor 2 family protein n=1 Tax=Pseudonocardia sp. WMMC193 TaxID=2911965 RepID=UPI001F1B3A09|nr:nuclear transport factor 2 family protein [Pseudonocardia sp. WMMC193]MCF7553423.1 nuclear transport factor 2 family protein [Pseudonocardia sp. WMMC193]